MTGAPLRVLCLDIEGGFGGSSRSLWEVLRHTDRSLIDAEVWCRKEGPAQARYQADRIPAKVMPGMPTVSALPRISRNLAVFGRFLLRDWRRSKSFRQELLAQLERRFDLLHCNHESLFFLAHWLHSRVSVPISCHIRTNLWRTPFARRQVRMLSTATADRLVFITENERRAFEDHLGNPVSGQVILNAASVPEIPPEPLEAFANEPRFKIACLSNYSWNRGIDRMVDLAEALASQGRRDILFIVAGDMRLPRALPGALGQIARRGGTLSDYAVARGVADMFAFLGHVDNPERVLASSHALIKPTREANPWGRDIIEALACAKPVIAIGEWTEFVSPGETGILHSDFDPLKMATEIARLSEDREHACNLGRRGKERVAALCDPRDRAADLAEFWRAAAVRSRTS